jgi:hypothetical protein
LVAVAAVASRFVWLFLVKPLFFPFGPDPRTSELHIMSDKDRYLKWLQDELKLLGKYRECAARILEGLPDCDYRDELAERLQNIDGAIADIHVALKG